LVSKEIVLVSQHRYEYGYKKASNSRPQV